MPVLKNPRRERYAQRLAQGKTQVKAFEEAGYKPNDGAASVMARNPDVSQRTKEILGLQSIKADINIGSVTNMLLCDRMAAYEEKQYSVAVQAANSVAKLHGLLVDKSETRALNVSVNLDLLDDSQLEQLEQLLAKAEGTKALPKPDES